MNKSKEGGASSQSVKKPQHAFAPILNSSLRDSSYSATKGKKKKSKTGFIVKGKKSPASMQKISLSNYQKDLKNRLGTMSSLDTEKVRPRPQP